MFDIVWLYIKCGYILNCDILLWRIISFKWY